jgi:hypothetical protein
MLLPLVLGCAGDDVEPTPWTFDAPDEEEPAPLATADLEAGLDAVIGTLDHVDPFLLWDTYEAALARGDGACPLAETHNNMQLNEGDCTTADGATSFYGYEISNRIEGFLYDDGQGGEWTRLWLWTTGAARIEGADGYLLEMLGDCLYRDYDTFDGVPAFSLYLWGDFRAADAGLDGTWLDEGLGLELYADLVGEAGARTVDWDGGITRIPGAIAAARLDGLTLTSACDVEPSGGLWLWDTDDRWYEVDFDDTCDGCVHVTLDGQDLGEACADWTPLIDWETQPWGG